MGRTAGDLMIRVNFTGTDRLSRMLDTITGKSRGAARDLAATNRELGQQTRELRDVQRQMHAANDNTGALAAKERTLADAVARSTARLERQRKALEINAKVARAGEVGRNLVSNGRGELFSAIAEAAPLVMIAKAGAEFQNLQNRMRVLGLDDGAVRNLTAYAQAMDVAGSSAKDNMRYLLEAQGAFRETGEHNPREQLAGAKLMAPILAKMHVAAKATGKGLSEEEERYMLRFVEQAGGLTDARRARQLADGVFRAKQSSGDNVNFANYQGFLAAAGSAGTHLTNRSMFADFEPLIAELHEQAGVGLASAYNRASGITKNAAGAKEFMKLGIWDPSKVVLNSMGGVKEYKGNPLMGKANELLARDPVEFYRQIVLPAYGRAGIKGEEVTRQNNMLFGRGGGKLFNLIDKQLPTLIKSRDSYKRTQGVDQAYGTTKDSFDGKLAQLTAAGNNFMVAASMKGGLLENVAGLIQSAAEALTTFTNWGNAHPKAFKWIMEIGTDLVVMRGGIALAKIAFGGMLGPVGQLWGLFSKIRLAGGVMTAFPMIARLAGIARVGVTLFAQAFLRAGLLMLTNPFVAAAAGIAVAGVLIYRNWGTIKVWLTAAQNWLAGLQTRFHAFGRNMIQGLVNGIASMQKAAHDAIANIGSNIVGWFKDKLGIHSPSRVFHGFGGNLMQGLGNGIAANARHPLSRIAAVAKAATGSMALAAAVPIHASPLVGRGAGAGAGAAAPVTIHAPITIVAAPNHSPRDIAEEVRRQLADGMRGARANRASFRDDPDGEDQ